MFLPFENVEEFFSASSAALRETVLHWDLVFVAI
jgi:hypothetical protein